MEDITLDVDREIEAFLEGPLPNAGPDDTRESLFARWFEVDPERALLGTGRRLRTLNRRVQDLSASRSAILAEYDRALEPLIAQIWMLESAVESVALARRAEDRGNVLELPGVGRWETRKVPGRWKVEDAEAAIAGLTGSERERYLVPQPDKLDARALLADIDTVLAARGGEVLPGLIKGEDRVSVTAKYGEAK